MKELFDCFIKLCFWNIFLIKLTCFIKLLNIFLVTIGNFSMMFICCSRTVFLYLWSLETFLTYKINQQLFAIQTIPKEQLRYPLQTTLQEIMVWFYYYLLNGYIFYNLFQKQVLNITNLLDSVLMTVWLIVVEIIVLHASGVRAGMFVRDAKALCPHLVIFPYNFKAYEEVNHFIWMLNCWYLAISARCIYCLHMHCI